MKTQNSVSQKTEPFPEDVWAGDSWCTDSRFSSVLVKLSQVFESALLDSILKLCI